MFSALETFVIIALYKSTFNTPFTIPCQQSSATAPPVASDTIYVYISYATMHAMRSNGSFTHTPRATALHVAVYSASVASYRTFDVQQHDVSIGQVLVEC